MPGGFCLCDVAVARLRLIKGDSRENFIGDKSTCSRVRRGSGVHGVRKFASTQQKANEANVPLLEGVYIYFRNS